MFVSKKKKEHFLLVRPNLVFNVTTLRPYYCPSSTNRKGSIRHGRPTQLTRSARSFRKSCYIIITSNLYRANLHERLPAAFHSGWTHRSPRTFVCGSDFLSCQRSVTLADCNHSLIYTTRAVRPTKPWQWRAKQTR